MEKQINRYYVRLTIELNCDGQGEMCVEDFVTKWVRNNQKQLRPDHKITGIGALAAKMDARPSEQLKQEILLMVRRDVQYRPGMSLKTAVAVWFEQNLEYAERAHKMWSDPDAFISDVWQKAIDEDEK